MAITNVMPSTFKYVLNSVLEMSRLSHIDTIESKVRYLCRTEASSPCFPLMAHSYQRFRMLCKSTLYEYPNQDAHTFEVMIYPSLQPTIKLQYVDKHVYVYILQLIVNEENETESDKPSKHKNKKIFTRRKLDISAQARPQAHARDSLSPLSSVSETDAD